ncbi:hypothetical protein WJX72_011281 [[Myrmecia] bisecta]|uniref:NADPH:adrenodoxin oxidoreductase, mitochondrial n=1 Tax=[Myrmecia] bisecta TaxID=41462 RepID=A0AAW1RA96_9CHLO
MFLRSALAWHACFHRSFVRSQAPVGCLPHTVSFATAADAPLHFCVVGSGPAGFYATDRLLKRFGDAVRVTLLDRLPTPFGLVRSGVAPDHPDTKNVINHFGQWAQDPRVEFVGNVTVGRDVQLTDLRRFYNAVILSYGAESNRQLNVPGRELKGTLSAREFVWWYNGHPEYRHLPIDLSATHAVAICGLGNVAIDCARILLRCPDELAKTDIAEHALAQLRQSAVKEVHLIGRRGPVQAAFTPKELRELLTLPGLQVHIDPQMLQLSPVDELEVKSTRMKRRVLEIITKAASASPKGTTDRHLHLHFLRTPAGILGDEEGGVSGLRLEQNELQVGQTGLGQRAVGTGRFEELKADLVLESIGYRSVPLDGVPFDQDAGIVPNELGRVLGGSSGSQPYERGLYVSGWVKRGPTGIIGTNLVDAGITVECIVEDAMASALPTVPANDCGAQALVAAIQDHGKQVVSFADWQKIDAAEVERGKAVGKPREKFTDVDEMLAVCKEQ